MAPPRFWDGQQRLKSPMAPGRVERASLEIEHNQASPATQRWSNRPGSEVNRHGHSGHSTDASDFKRCFSNAPRWEHLGQSRQEGLWSWWRGDKWYEQKQAPGPKGPRYEETHWQGHSHSRHVFWGYANLENRRQAAVASVEAVPCLGDEEVRERWQEHIEDSRDPERSAKRIHWLISRLQMQGYNRPVETQAPVQSSMADLLEIAKREQQELNAEASEGGENLTSTTASAVGENLTSTEQNTHTEKDKEEDVQDDWLDFEESSHSRRRRGRRRFGRGNDREDRSKLSKLQVSTELGIFDDFLHNRSKMGLLLGWLLGRVAAFLCGFLSAKLGTPVNIDSTIMQVLGAPVHWLIACIAAAWLGSLAVTSMEHHSIWKIGCLAACVFTLVV